MLPPPFEGASEFRISRFLRPLRNRKGRLAEDGRDAHALAGRTVRPADAWEESWLYPHCSSDASTGHRREYSDLFPAQSSVVAEASGAESGRAGHSEVPWAETWTRVERWRRFGDFFVPAV